MKLPWNKKYLEISFHVIITLIIIYALTLLIGNLSKVVMSVEGFLEYIIRLLSPLIIAVIFSYIYNPVVERLQGFFYKLSKNGEKKTFIGGKKPKNKIEKRFETRFWGTAILYIVLVSVFIAVLFLLLSGLFETDLKFVEEKIRASVFGFTDILKRLNLKLVEVGIIESETDIIDYITRFLKLKVDGSINYFASKAGDFGSFMTDFVIGLLTAFYFLSEKKKILYYGTQGIKTFFGRFSDGILDSLSEANTIFSGYIKGQIADGVVMATLISIALLIIGVDYPIIIGVISGISNLIPYVGAIVAFVLAVSVALIGGVPTKALYAAITIILLQQIDSAIIVPKLVGDNVRLQPVLVILSISIFGSVFGIWGMIFAVPVAAMLKVMAKRIIFVKKV